MIRAPLDCRSRLRYSRSLVCLLALIANFGIASADDSNTVPVGITIPLSGGFADWGEAARRGAELFAARPGNRFRFDYQDEVQGDPQKALAAFWHYRRAGINYIVQGTSAGLKAVIPLTAREDTLLFSVGLLDDQILQTTNRLVGFATQISTESNFLGEHITKRGFKRIAILNRQDPFSQEFARTLKVAIEQYRGAVITQQVVEPTEADFRPYLLRMKKLNLDAICFNVSQDKEGLFVQQARQLGFLAAMFSNYDFETQAALPFHALLDKVEYSFPLNTAEGSPLKKEFDQRFAARFGADAHPLANTYFIYDGLTLLDQALSNCATTDVECVNRFFKSTKTFTGVSGTVTFRKDGSNSRPYGMKAVRNGKFVWLNRE